MVILACLSADGQTEAVAFNSISKAEIEMLLVDVGKTNPKILEQLANDPEMKKKQIEDLRQLLAFASQAQRDGMASVPANKHEIENIYAETLATNYDREINKGKAAMPALSYITDATVNAFWADKGVAGQRTHEAEFNDFLNAKMTLLKAGSPEMKDREITEDEQQQARDVFARVRIYKAEYEQKVKYGGLSKEFIDKTNLQVKLQEAQFLSRLYAEKIAERTKATDADITKYIAAHPALDPAPKKAKAQGILERARAGEDFATLANKFSDDPGNKGPGAKVNGGLYKDLPRGRMSAPFEEAALALQPGQISPELVETDFGYHVIKLVRKGVVPGSKAETYDVRHILISTGYKDPDDPTAREKPIKEYVRAIIETANEKKLAAEIIAANNIQVPDDFAVPAVSKVPQPIKKP